MVVRMRRNRSQTAKRRSHHAISGVRLSKCECGALRVSHRACPNCGKYNGKVIIDVVARAKRDARRTKRKETALRESGYDTGQKESEPATATKS
jgi:large subunit ribosomal protein L32